MSPAKKYFSSRILISLILLLVLLAGTFGATDFSDLDSDGVSAGIELIEGSNPLKTNSDSDVFDDGQEINIGTNPTKTDTDDDGLDDGEEVKEYRTDPLKKDSDGDGLTDREEVIQYDTDPAQSDTDSDSLNDGAEVEKYGTDPLKKDSDGDGLKEGKEIRRYDTDPAQSDTDSDSLNDRIEVEEYGTDPTQADTDDDGIPDGVEVREHGTDPTEVDTDAESEEATEYEIDPNVDDSDSDGLDDRNEINEYGTDPTKSDTDGDGLNDSKEVHEYETDPNQNDTDRDRLTDAEELMVFDTDPLDPDTDGDGLDDGNEVYEYDTDPTEVTGEEYNKNKDSDGDGVTDYEEEVLYGTNSTDTDSDNDGFEDGLEINPPEPISQADPTKKDVFVEVDYIEGAKPSKAKLQTVVEAFDEAPVEGYQESEGINLHITVDEKIEEQTTTDEVDLPILRNEYKNTNGQGHHYGLAVVDAYSDGDDVGGVALRTSAAFTFQKSSYPPDGYAYTHMEAAFMHELGHSLGISSDVYDGVDSKSKSFSEYPSVMNYNHKTYSEGVGTQQDPLQYSDGEGHDDWGYIEMTFSQPPTHNLD